MPQHWMLQSQASLRWIRVSVSHKNFNDSFVDFLDMHHLAPGVCQVINQRPTLLIQSPVLTSALSHPVAEGWRLSTKPMGQKTIQTSIEHQWHQAWQNICSAHVHCITKEWVVLIYISNITEVKQGSQSIFDLSKPSAINYLPMLFLICITWLLRCNFLRKHDIKRNVVLSSDWWSWTYLPVKEEWNLITPDYAV